MASTKNKNDIVHVVFHTLTTSIGIECLMPHSQTLDFT